MQQNRFSRGAERPRSISKGMKRTSNIFHQFENIDVIKQIILDAAKGKKKRKEVRDVLDNLNHYAVMILEMLQNDSYRFGPIKTMTINDSKKQREISISPFFPNRILDRILVDMFKPQIRKSMYQYCVGNVDGRGILYGMKYTKKMVKRYRYYVKLDIRKFYPSVSAQNMLAFLERQTKDKRALILAKAVLSQSECLPIGAYYSQWFSNYYLQDLDHYIKEVLGIPAYVRYVDDMVLLSNDRNMLEEACKKIEEFLLRKELTLKENWQIHAVEDVSLDFLGFRFETNKTLLRTGIFRKMNSNVNKKHRRMSVKRANRVLSYISWLLYTSVGYRYYKNRLCKKIRKGYLRRLVSTISLKKEVNKCRKHSTYEPYKVIIHG